MKQRLAGAPQRQQPLRTVLLRAAFFFAAMTLCPPLPGAEQAETKPSAQKLAAEEKEGCMKNLQAIYAAIEAYRADHKDIPNWFSDLVPDYLTNVNVLICPVSRRTGKVDAPQLSDPRIASSYLFEFCPLPLGTSAPANPKVTRREWKRKQMGAVGSIVPLVRCRLHQKPLNLAFDGRVYESPPAWESMLTNLVDPESLSPARMFPAGAETSAKPVAPKKSYPARDTNAAPRLLDLTPFYNARLTDTWHGDANATGNDLSSLPAGVQTLAGVDYDVRGVVQLGSKAPTANRFPTNALGIKVHQKCQRVHFLHSAAFGHAADDGKQIGVYVVHFASNQMRLEVPIVYGKDVRDWHYWAAEKEAPGLKLAWKGENKTSKAAGSYIRLFETTWTNIVPEVEIESIDFLSSLSQPAPFLMAITLE
jgi:hypothetical protein